MRVYILNVGSEEAMAKVSSSTFWSDQVEMVCCDLETDLAEPLDDFLSLRKREAVFNTFNAL